MSVDVPPLSKHERFRSWLYDQHPILQITYKLLIAVVGFLVVAVGLVMVPLPGPGWLIVFAGLALLGLEFPLFKKLNKQIRGKFIYVWLQLKRRYQAWKRKRAHKKTNL